MAGAVHAALADHPDDDTVILVVHSGAGALVPSIVDGHASPVRAIVFVDATLPYPGRRWLATVPAEMRARLRALADADGVLPRWHEWFPADVVRDLLPDPTTRAAFCAEIPRLPLAYFEETAPVVDAWVDQPCGYLQLSAAYDDAAAEARRRAWPVARHDGHHLSAVTEPAAVAEAILAMANRLQN
ncbi:alpha/beta fold hydrolase [Pseudonocardia nigra]|uniref:alpha/beta fold hydrolase n=1 Tax=Pseudonocardia nigra TaxID=1921578 RepID=UPI001FEC3798|nr:alpha/beta fold hydrolase [Pseudonocardia nigra]